MNRTIKFGLAALAIASLANVYAEESETVGEEPVGWTPVALGLATPVQLPWGINRWDVNGLDLNLFYSDTPVMNGLMIGGLAATVRQDLCGWQISGLCNYNGGDVYGIRTTLGINIARKSVYGFDAGLASIALEGDVDGLSIHFLGAAQNNMCGCQIGGIANVSMIESYGASIALGANIAKTAYGLQLACIFNMCEELHGAQVALVNYADLCENGFQIGLVNVIRSNVVPVLPFVNGHF